MDAETEERFPFGANWARFLEQIDESRIAAAVEALVAMLQSPSLAGQRFLDVGSGSGLSSLAAQRLGAVVHSFDFDPGSVACTAELRRRYGAASGDWTVERGSALDAQYLESLGEFDVVYSWGVLHHTGDLWTAMDLVARRVAPGGRLFVAIYNDQGPVSDRWKRIKRLYQRLPRGLKTALVILVGAGFWLRRLSAAGLSLLLRLLTLRNPLVPMQMLWTDLHVRNERGMHAWYDLVDWVGGWPFEVAQPEEVFRFLRDRGFVLREMTTCGGGLGCNQFVFDREKS
ncbi:MAG: class I SAM-dependent methyltransferase [Planctomycetaceae bacterium]|nr:class I SAM-dependent methyltransferase [Planctomycetaceae bacterium]